LIVKSLDDDNNGAVDRGEFINWVMKGLEKVNSDPNEIHKLLNSNDIGRKMGSFILAIKAHVIGY
jgi:Ca2+-binding EF-hand superfamily protein